MASLAERLRVAWQPMNVAAMEKARLKSKRQAKRRRLAVERKAERAAKAARS
jgi:hypothetical protein